MNPFSIAIVADDPLARAGLAMMLQHVDSIDVIAQLAGDDFLQEDEAETAVYDAILWDLGWMTPDAIPSYDDTLPPVILLAPEESDSQLLWQSGCKAILGRQIDPDQLAAAIAGVVAGLMLFDPETAVFPTNQTIPLTDDLEMAEELTPRESDVLQLLAQGLTNKAIAQQLDISSHTVKFHVNAIMTKLNAQSRTDAVVRATRLGLIML